MNASGYCWYSSRINPNFIRSFIINHIKYKKLVISRTKLKSLLIHISSSDRYNDMTRLELCQAIDDYIGTNTLHRYRYKGRLPVIHKKRKNSKAIISIRERLLSKSFMGQTFHNITLVGKGGFGSIYKAQHLLDNQMYAIKIIKASCVSNMSEISILSMLSHPNIVTYKTSWIEKNYYDGIANTLCFEATMDDDTMDEATLNKSIHKEINDGMIFIQMELCDITMERFLKQYQSIITPYQPYVSCHIIKQILAGLHFIHSHDIVHCDIKPSNILIKYVEMKSPSIFDKFVVKIADFGLACHAQHHMSNPLDQSIHLAKDNDGDDDGDDDDGSVIIKRNHHPTQNQKYRGTSLYASHEQYNYGVIHKPSDIYSAGLLFFEILNTFSTTMEKYVSFGNLKRERLFPKYMMSSASAKDIAYFTTLILAMTNMNPSLRPSAETVIDVIDSYLNDVDISQNNVEYSQSNVLNQ